jgi:hypothetical protein
LRQSLLGSQHLAADPSDFSVERLKHFLFLVSVHTFYHLALNRLKPGRVSGIPF